MLEIVACHEIGTGLTLGGDKLQMAGAIGSSTYSGMVFAPMEAGCSGCLLRFQSVL
jgi:hypothetical protein